jgi:hypothetical protein
MLDEGCWKVMGDTMVPYASLVIQDRYWKPMGGLLALALLIGENLHPVSPVVIYALLCNVHPRSDPRAPMHLSLGFIEELVPSKANDLIPWMIIPPHQDWRLLPEGHRAKVLELATGLDVDVSRLPSSVLLSES